MLCGALLILLLLPRLLRQRLTHDGPTRAAADEMCVVPYCYDYHSFGCVRVDIRQKQPRSYDVCLANRLYPVKLQLFIYWMPYGNSKSAV